ncbi:unnamed protein product [Effrenium voratum]|nr:unnamed protein product [Effrenium voratum]
MLQLNLTLPPDPKAKHAPASLEESAGDIILGDGSQVSEVPRLLAQSTECLRWNAALALYILGMDLAQLMQESRSTRASRDGRRGRSKPRCCWRKTCCSAAGRRPSDVASLGFRSRIRRQRRAFARQWAWMTCLQRAARRPVTMHQ